MFAKYLKVAFRNLLRDKVYSVVNIVGLSIAVAACITIFLIVHYDLAFDRFHTKYEDIYRVVHTVDNAAGRDYFSTTPYPFVTAFRNDFPDVPQITGIHYEMQMDIISEEKTFTLNDVVFADSLFLDVFDFKILSGNPRAALAQPGKIFLTLSSAERIFGTQNVIGKTIKVGNHVDAEIAGVLDDPPATSHMWFSMIISMPTFSSDFIRGLPTTEWSVSKSGMSYLVLPEKMDVQSLEKKLSNLVRKYHKLEEAKIFAYHLQPLRDIHFSDTYTFNPGSMNVQWSSIVSMSLLGIFILIIACINFIHLSTAVAFRRSKEVGIRKSLGANRRHITFNFLLETSLIVALATLLGLGLTERFLPWISNFLDKSLLLTGSENEIVWIFIVLLICAIVAVAGVYPAIVLSKFNPAKVLKGQFTGTHASGLILRRVLIVFQFIVVQALIIATLLISSQLDFFRSKPLGFDTKGIVNVSLPDQDASHRDHFKSLAMQVPGIADLSFSGGSPTSVNNFSTSYFITSKGADSQFNGLSLKPVDVNYLNTFGLKLKAGRWFTESDVQLSVMSQERNGRPVPYIINEAVVRQLGFTNPDQVIGLHLTTGVMNAEGEVIGVVENFHTHSLHQTIEPVLLMNFPFLYYEAGIRFNTKNVRELIAAIEKNWKDTYQDANFHFQFLDEHLESLYRSEERTFTVFKIFALLSIFIGCLGLYGMVSFMTGQKTREVGIRKILGASVGQIVFLFGREFLVLIIIAFVIASPFVFYGMSSWLERFAYHAPMHLYLFVLGIAVTACIAMLTVGYQSVRAARANPVDTLRTE